MAGFDFAFKMYFLGGSFTCGKLLCSLLYSRPRTGRAGAGCGRRGRVPGARPPRPGAALAGGGGGRGRGAGERQCPLARGCGCRPARLPT